jgi:hypothetical protein
MPHGCNVPKRKEANREIGEKGKLDRKSFGNRNRGGGKDSIRRKPKVLTSAQGLNG